MYDINMAKYQQHPVLQTELLQTGTDQIIGGPSTTWSRNGVQHGWTCGNLWASVQSAVYFRVDGMSWFRVLLLVEGGSTTWITNNWLLCKI